MRRGEFSKLSRYLFLRPIPDTDTTLTCQNTSFDAFRLCRAAYEHTRYIRKTPIRNMTDDWETLKVAGTLADLERAVRSTPCSALTSAIATAVAQSTPLLAEALVHTFQRLAEDADWSGLDAMRNIAMSAKSFLYKVARKSPGQETDLRSWQAQMVTPEDTFLSFSCDPVLHSWNQAELDLGVSGRLAALFTERLSRNAWRCAALFCQSVCEASQSADITHGSFRSLDILDAFVRTVSGSTAHLATTFAVAVHPFLGVLLTRALVDPCDCRDRRSVSLLIQLSSTCVWDIVAQTISSCEAYHWLFARTSSVWPPSIPFPDREFWARATVRSIALCVERGEVDAAAASICCATDRIVADPFNVRTSTMLLKAVDSAGGLSARGRGWDEVVKCVPKLVSAIAKDACPCRLQFLTETVASWLGKRDRRDFETLWAMIPTRATCVDEAGM